MLDEGTVASLAPDEPATPPDYRRSREQAIADAKAAGLEVCEPADNELFLDIDSAEQLGAYQRLFSALLDRCNTPPGHNYVNQVTRSKSGNWHVRLRMPWTLTPMERIAWQAALGSDPMRELLSMLDLRNGDERPTLFFEKPGWNDADLPF